MNRKAFMHEQYHFKNDRTKERTSETGFFTECHKAMQLKYLKIGNLREKLAISVLDELIEWTLNTSGRTISIFDATNTIKLRRKALVDKLEKRLLDNNSKEIHMIKNPIILLFI